MREIKFRAYDTIGERWLDNQELAIDLSGNWIMFDGTEYYQADRREYIELSQYIGLKDKNGVEIWEGDIVTDLEDWQEPINYVVGFEQAGFWLLNRDNNEYGWCDDNDLEVIGNIYENKELLNDNL